MEHNHSHAAPALENINRAFYIGITLNALFTIIEFVVGYKNNSLALIADASHNLSDVMSLVISLLGMKLAQKAATKFYTYGYKKASILASLINAVLLIVIVINIIRAGIQRLETTPEVMGSVIIYTALIGVLINSISAFLFWKGQKEDINIKGAFLHLLVDAIVSVGVVISGIIIVYTGWNIVDPIISFVIALVIMVLTWGLFKESLKLVMDGVPDDMDASKIKSLILQNPNVTDVHHMHVWAISSSENALTAHIRLKETVEYTDHMSIKKEIKHDLLHENIQHVTLELESSEDDCEEIDC